MNVAGVRRFLQLQKKKRRFMGHLGLVTSALGTLIAYIAQNLYTVLRKYRYKGEGLIF